MRIEQARRYQNKKIKIVLISGHNYNGVVKKVYDDYLIMIDKYSEEVLIYYNSVSAITHVSDNPIPYRGSER